MGNMMPYKQQRIIAICGETENSQAMHDVPQTAKNIHAGAPFMNGFCSACWGSAPIPAEYVVF